MYTAPKKTRVINSFKRTAVQSPRDLYARYGQRMNPRAIHGSNGRDNSNVIPPGTSVIQSMIAAQRVLDDHKESIADNH